MHVCRQSQAIWNSAFSGPSITACTCQHGAVGGGSCPQPFTGKERHIIHLMNSKRCVPIASISGLCRNAQHTLRVWCTTWPWSIAMTPTLHNSH
jgi:hypothetical protein